MDIYKYKISDTQYLQVNPECLHKDDCSVCIMGDFDYIDETKSICIRFGYGFIDSFSCKFTEGTYVQNLINDKQKIDKSINFDLGIECNQFFSGRQQDNLFMKYYFLGNDHKKIRPYYNSWMYNDEDGNVIFEITPFYPYLYETKKSHPDFVTYKQFMKSYQPILKTMIPKKNLQQWIKQARELEKIYFPEFAEAKNK